MKNKKRLLALMLTPFVLSQSITALAAKADNNPQGDQHTTIGIMESATEVGQASFEVPLYITTAAVKGQTKLMCPEGYDIKNTAGNNSIGVLSLTVHKVAGGEWSLVKTTPAADKEVQITIGDLILPAINTTTQQKTVDFTQAGDGDNTAFRKNNKIVAIAPGKTLSETNGGAAPGTAGYKGLGISGQVSNATRTDKGAAAQFRITYVVSALDANGAAIGNIYVGDSKAAAGL